MWGLLGLAILMALNPIIFALILLMISRPRPFQNLLAFWTGSLAMNLPALLIPLVVLHSTPAFASFAQNLATRVSVEGAAVSHIQIGVGVLGLSIAVVMLVRGWTSPSAREKAGRGEAQPPRQQGRHRLDARRAASASPPVVVTLSQGHGTSVAHLERRAATDVLAEPADDQVAESVPALRRMGSRARNAWENGALWVAFLLGMGCVAGPYVVLLVDTTIVASGAPIATQFVGAIMFLFVMLLPVEVTIISHLLAPARTEAVLRPVHDWARVHRRQILMTMFAVVGVWQVTKGMGII